MFRQTPEQQAMVKQLQASTRLNDAFSIQCLSESGWSLEKALASAFSLFPREV